MYAVETVNLTKCFGSVKAVDNLSLRVPEGSIYGFLGPNGAGKTTTLKMLLGLTRPTSGQIRICGKPVEFGSSRHPGDTGFLPDVPNFYDWMNADEYLRFCGELLKLEPGTLKKRIGELLELVGLAEVKKKIKSYSRGMKQRLGIAQALIGEPSVLFLDEPTSALDPIGRKEVMEIISRLSGKMTVFFSTHILSDVERVCDRVVILDKGKMMLEDSMENLHKQVSTQTLLVEVEDGENGLRLVQLLKQLPWIKGMPVQTEEGVRIPVRELALAQREIPRILAEQGMALKHFSLQEPSLEDIFLKVVDN